MPGSDPTLLQQLISSALAGLLGMVGAIANFFYEIDKGRRVFTFAAMFFVSVVGFVIGSAAGSFIPSGENWYGWTLVVGLNAYPLMAAMKERCGPVLDRIIKRVLGD